MIKQELRNWQVAAADVIHVVNVCAAGVQAAPPALQSETQSTHTGIQIAVTCRSQCLTVHYAPPSTKRPAAAAETDTGTRLLTFVTWYWLSACSVMNAKFPRGPTTQALHSHL